MLGAYRMAVVISSTAVEVLVEREPSIRLEDAARRWVALQPPIRDARLSDDQPSEQLVLDILEIADVLIGASESATHPGRIAPRNDS